MDQNGPVGQPAKFSNLDSANSSFGGSGLGRNYDLAFVISWISIALAIIGCISIWLLDTSVVQSKKQKQTQKDTLIQKVTSSEYADLDQKVSGLKSAYDEIHKDMNKTFYISEFLPSLYQYIDKDVQIKNISITNEGKLNIDGITDNYRSVADQMLALQTFPKLSKIELLSTSMNTTSSGSTEVPFVFSALIDESDEEADTSETNSIDVTTDEAGQASLDSNVDSLNTNSAEAIDATGGIDATIQ